MVDAVAAGLTRCHPTRVAADTATAVSCPQARHVLPPLQQNAVSSADLLVVRQMEIQCSVCLLRPLVAADALALARHANDRDIWLNLRDRFPHPYGLSDAEDYIAAVAARPTQISFGIDSAGEAAGTVSLMLGEDIARRTAEIGYWLGRAYWGRGIMTAAVRAVTTYALATLALDRVFALPFVENEASSRVLERAGYRREGRMRHSALKAGVVRDQWLYAHIRDDAEAVQVS